MTYYVLFFIELPTRMVRIAGITTNPAEAWMLQIARDACDVDDGVLSEGRSPSSIGTRTTRATGVSSLKSRACR